MQQLIIVGAGGMGRTMYDMARESLGYGGNFEIRGFIDDNINALEGFSDYPPLLCSISEYMPKVDEVLICSIGGESRKPVMQSLLTKGAVFIPLIHKSARISPTAKLGKGLMVGAFTTIAADAVIGDYNFIQSNTIIGHDVKIGDWNRIDSHVMLVGGITVGHHNMIHTSAVINHFIHIGSDTHIGALSFVTRDVEDGATVFGNPARRLK